MAAECIVERTSGYTVMSNHHLRDRNLSLKAKGLLSLILSLPKEWDYTIRGLATICAEGKQAVGAALSELEKAGYIERHKLLSGGKFAGTQYIIREIPVSPCPGFRDTENPAPENPDPENPAPENQPQIIKDKSIKDQSNKEEKPSSKKLTQKELEDQLKQGIETMSPSWTDEQKTAVHKLLCEFYGPRAVSGKPPIRTIRGVKGVFRTLASEGRGDYLIVSAALNTAIERGWTAVYPKAPPGAVRPSVQPQRSEDLGEAW